MLVCVTLVWLYASGALVLLSGTLLHRREFLTVTYMALVHVGYCNLCRAPVLSHVLQVARLQLQREGAKSVLLIHPHQVLRLLATGR